MNTLCVFFSLFRIKIYQIKWRSFSIVVNHKILYQAFWWVFFYTCRENVFWKVLCENSKFCLYIRVNEISKLFQLSKTFLHRVLNKCSYGCTCCDVDGNYNSIYVVKMKWYNHLRLMTNCEIVINHTNVYRISKFFVLSPLFFFLFQIVPLILLFTTKVGKGLYFTTQWHWKLWIRISCEMF